MKLRVTVIMEHEIDTDDYEFHTIDKIREIEESLPYGKKEVAEMLWLSVTEIRQPVKVEVQ